MWIFDRIKGGYVRSKHIADKDVFVLQTLSNASNRSIWRKLCQKTVCKLFKHAESQICVQKGYSNERGNFRVVLCKWCFNSILFYEGRKHR